jgi:hypothetical protein
VVKASIGIEGPRRSNAACSGTTTATIELIRINAAPPQNPLRRAGARPPPHRPAIAIAIEVIADLIHQHTPPWTDVDGVQRALHRFSLHDAAAPGDARRAVLGVRLAGIEPDTVLQLRILRRRDVVYEVSGYHDPRGRFVPAGVLIAAMAWRESAKGLVIGTSALGLTLSAMTVELQARADARGIGPDSLQVELGP